MRSRFFPLQVRKKRITICYDMYEDRRKSKKSTEAVRCLKQVQCRRLREGCQLVENVVRMGLL